MVERGRTAVFGRLDDGVLEKAHLRRSRALVANGTDDENASVILAARQLGFSGDIVALVEEPYHRKPMMLFSITVEERPERAGELSGLMCMAISGGALVPLVMGQLVDMELKAIAFIVPAACFAYLLLISLKGGRKPAAA